MPHPLAPEIADEPTVSKTEFYRQLRVYNTNDGAEGKPLASETRYVWVYEQWDHKTHKPYPFHIETGRLREIDPIRTDCLETVSKMDAENKTIPQRIAESKVSTYMDQWAEMVVACVNKQLQSTYGERNVLAIICLQSSGGCIGPKEYPFKD